MSDDGPIPISRPTKKRKGKQPRVPTGHWEDAILHGRDGIEEHVANVITIFGNHPDWADVFVFDEFGQVITTTRVPPWDPDDAPTDAKPGEWTDSDTVRAQAWLARRYQLKVGSKCVYDAVRVLAEKKTINPPKIWLESLRWDKCPRVDCWLTNYLGARLSIYVSSVGKWMLISAVARIMQPGCKVDTMLVLEGPQGRGKSTSLRVLFSPSWFSDTPLDLNSKDRFVGLRHNWCHEMAELDALGKAEIARVKSFLSSPSDDFRAPYGKSNVKVERRCIFVGTVNDSEYLRDPTGNRRFWPVRCGKIDLVRLGADREQLMAEALVLFQMGERWWPEGVEVGRCETAQSERAHQDAWFPFVATYVDKQFLLFNDATFITVGDVLTGAIGIEKDQWTQAEQNTVSRCLQQLGWQQTRRRRRPSDDERAVRVHGYVPHGVDVEEPVVVPGVPGSGEKGGTGEAQ